jgi:hypothetical protein
MSWHDEADAVRIKVDELALSRATVDDWRLVDAQLFHALVEAKQQADKLHREMVEVAQSARPDWCWFEKRGEMLELREVMDDLRVLRMCVQSRIFELEAGAALASL